MKILPSDIERGGPYFRTTKDVIEAITYYRFKSESPSDPLKYVKERYEPFEDIEGFSGDINCWHTIEDAIKKFTS